MHEAIIDAETWTRTREILKANARVKDPSKRTRRDVPLRGIIRCGHCGCPMMPTYGTKKGVAYHYYLCEKHDKRALESDCPVQKVPAGVVENLVKEQMDKVFRSPDVLKALVEKTGMSGEEVCGMFRDKFWREITSAEFTRLAQLILDKVTLFDDHIELEIRSGGLKNIMKEFVENEG